MPIEDKPPQPESKPTITIPREDILSAQIKQVLAALADHRKNMSDRFDAQDITLKRVADEGVETNVRITHMEATQSDLVSRVGQLEGRANTTSMKVSGASQIDLAHEAQLAQERAAREALAEQVNELAKTNATQLNILNRLDKITDNPTVKKLGYALAGVLFLALNYATIYLTSHHP